MTKNNTWIFISKIPYNFEAYLYVSFCMSIYIIVKIDYDWITQSKKIVVDYLNTNIIKSFNQDKFESIYGIKIKKDKIDIISILQEIEY